MKTKFTLPLIKITFLFLFFPLISLAQTIDIDAESRTRGYFAHGIGMLPPKNVSSANFIEQRTRFNIDFKKNNLQFYFGLEDSRYWGQEGNPSADFDKNLGVYQAYIKYQFAKSYSAKFGRQVIAYDNERLFTSGNWTSWGHSFDLAVFKYQKKPNGFFIDLGLGVSASKATPYITNFKAEVAKYIGYAYLNQFFWDDKLQVSIFSIMNGLQGTDRQADTAIFDKTRTVYINELIGPYIEYEHGNLQLEAEMYYEFGKTQDGRDLSAFFYAFAGTYNIADSLLLTVGYERNSGTDWSKPSSKTSSNAFLNYYGEGNEYLGYLCLFVDGSSTNGAGLQDLYVNVRYSPWEKLWFEPTVHFFSLTQDYLESGEKVDRFLGTELDFGITYLTNKELSFSLISSYLWQERTLEQIPVIGVPDGKRGGIPYMFRFQVLYSPKIFSWKK